MLNLQEASTNFLTKDRRYEVYATKIISLENSFEYESNGVIFVAYIL
jgi:hypothetical protein